MKYKPNGGLIKFDYRQDFKTFPCQLGSHGRIEKVSFSFKRIEPGHLMIATKLSSMAIYLLHLNDTHTVWNGFSKKFDPDGEIEKLSTETQLGATWNGRVAGDARWRVRLWRLSAAVHTLYIHTHKHIQHTQMYRPLGLSLCATPDRHQEELLLILAVSTELSSAVCWARPAVIDCQKGEGREEEKGRSLTK